MEACFWKSKCKRSHQNCKKRMVPKFRKFSKPLEIPICYELIIVYNGDSMEPNIYKKLEKRYGDANPSFYVLLQLDCATPQIKSDLENLSLEDFKKVRVVLFKFGSTIVEDLFSKLGRAFGRVGIAALFNEIEQEKQEIIEKMVKYATLSRQENYLKETGEGEDQDKKFIDNRAELVMYG